MKEQLYIFEVIKNQYNKGKNENISETIVSPSLELVLEYLSKDRADPAIDIISINKVALVNAVL